MRQFAFALLSVLCACKSAVPPGGYGVDLTIDATQLTQRAAVVDLTIAASGAETFYTGAIDARKQIQHGGLVRIRYVPKVASGTLVFDVDAIDGGGTPIGVAQAAVTLEPMKAVQLTVVLADPTMSQPDMSTDDQKPASCNNATLDPDETDIDCGGSCSPCAPSKRCSSDTDCATHTCTAVSGGDMLSRVCELATGPPGWVVVQSLPHGRAFAGAAGPSDGTILVIGGHTTQTDASTYQLSLETNTWTNIAGMSVAREAMPVVMTGNQVFAIGGEYASMPGPVDSAWAAIEVFDLTAKTWTPIMRTLSAQRALLGAAVGANHLVYAVGGEAFPDTTALATFESFDPAADVAAACDAQPALPLARAGVAAVTDSLGHIVVVGGLITSGTTAVQSRVDTYDTTTTAWTQSPSLSTPRGNVGAALGADNRVYAVGGQNDVGGALADVEALAPESDHWTHLPTISPARTGIAVTRGWDGRIYAIGGRLQGGAVDTTVQAYGPSIAPGPSSGAVGAAVALAGTNFAGNAHVTITYTDASNNTATAATGTTNALGTLSPSPVWKVPTTLAAGIYTLIAVDDRSRFPVQARFTVTP